MWTEKLHASGLPDFRNQNLFQSIFNMKNERWVHLVDELLCHRILRYRKGAIALAGWVLVCVFLSVKRCGLHRQPYYQKKTFQWFDDSCVFASLILRWTWICVLAFLCWIGRGRVWPIWRIFKVHKRIGQYIKSCKMFPSLNWDWRSGYDMNIRNVFNHFLYSYMMLMYFYW